MADDEFALLHLLLGRRRSAVSVRPSTVGQGSRQAFFGEGIAIVLGDVIAVQIELGDAGGVSVIHRIRVLRIEIHRGTIDVGDRLRHQERRDGADRAVRQNDGLHKTRRLSGGLREQAPSPRVGAEVEVKGSVLLEENKHVFDVLLQQSEFRGMAESRRFLQATRVAGDFSAGSRCDFDNFLLVRKPVILRVFGQRRDGLDHQRSH